MVCSENDPFIPRKKYKGNIPYNEKVYEGECKNDMYNGKGKIFKNGQLDNDGQWKHNLRHGLGKLYKN